MTFPRYLNPRFGDRNLLGIPYRNYIDGFIVFGARDTFGENLDLGILIWIKRKLDGFMAFFFKGFSIFKLGWEKTLSD